MKLVNPHTRVKTQELKVIRGGCWRSVEPRSMYLPPVPWFHTAGRAGLVTTSWRELGVRLCVRRKDAKAY